MTITIFFSESQVNLFLIENGKDKLVIATFNQTIFLSIKQISYLMEIPKIGDRGLKL